MSKVSSYRHNIKVTTQCKNVLLQHDSCAVLAVTKSLYLELGKVIHFGYGECKEKDSTSQRYQEGASISRERENSIKLVKKSINSK